MSGHFPEGRQDAGYIDETWEATDLREIQSKINRDLTALAARMTGPALFEERGDRYDIRYRDRSFLDYVADPPSERFYSNGWIKHWMAGLTPEALDPDEPVAYDGFGAPLYAHQLPPEGTE